MRRGAATACLLCTAAASARPTAGLPPLSTTATHFSPTMKPMFAMSPKLSDDVSSWTPAWTNTPAAISVTSSGATSLPRAGDSAAKDGATPQDNHHTAPPTLLTLGLRNPPNKAEKRGNRPFVPVLEEANANDVPSSDGCGKTGLRAGRTSHARGRQCLRKRGSADGSMTRRLHTAPLQSAPDCGHSVRVRLPAACSAGHSGRCCAWHGMCFESGERPTRAAGARRRETVSGPMRAE